MTQRYSIEELRRLLEDRVQAFCERYLPGGYRDGPHWRCSDIYGTAPARKDGDGSFVMNLTGAHPGLWHDFASDEKGDQLDVLKVQANGDMKAAIREAKAFLGISGEDPKRPIPPRKESTDAEAAAEAARKLELARKIWDEATPDLTGPAELYLQFRGIWLDPWPAAIRFHPRLRFKRAELPNGPKVYVPGLVLRVDNVAGEFIGIQRVFLDPKKPIKLPGYDKVKLSLGEVSGGAIRLRDGPTRRLRVIEGPENGCSVLDMLGGEDALWAIPGAGNMPSLELPDDCEEIIIFGDFDPPKGKAGKRPGQENARKLADKALSEGRRVKAVFTGQEGVDWNDLLREHGDAAADMVRDLEAKAPWLLPTPPDDPVDDGPPPMDPDDPGPQPEDVGIGGGDAQGVEYFLPKYAYVQEIGRFVDRETGALLKKEQVTDYHRWHYYGKLANDLLRDPRLLRSRGLTFWPGQPELVHEGVKDCLNLWHPDPNVVQPKRGDISPFLDHLREVTADEEVAYTYLLNWMCHVVRFPGSKVHSAPLLIGRPGTGKSLLTQILRAIVGDPYVREVGPQELERDFNEYVLQAQVLVIEEMRVKDRFEVTNRLKPWITNNKIQVNTKGVPGFEFPNRMNLILYSNELGALNIEKGDRRYMVSMSDREPRDEDYFTVLFGWLQREGYAAIHHYLLNEHDLEEFNPKGHAPWTKAKAFMQEISASPLEMRLNALLDAREPPFHTDLVRIEDVQEVLPEKLARNGERAISIWMKREGGVKLALCRLASGRRHWIWAMRRTKFWEKQDAKTIADYYDRMRNAPPEQGSMPFVEEGGRTDEAEA